MKLTNERLMAFANALEMLSPSMSRTQQLAQRQMSSSAPQMKTPRVRGNLAYPILAWRVGQAKIAVGPKIAAFQIAQDQQIAAHRIRPEKKDGEPMPAEETWPSDGRAVAAAMRVILDEEVDLGDLKPLTWDILKKAGIVGGTPTYGDEVPDEDEIEFDGSFVAALGSFLEGEPTDDPA